MFLVSLGFAQNQFQVLTERPGEKTFKGILSREVVQNDSSFKWYAENLKGYTPHADALAGLKKNADSIQLLVFMGTWCEDSHFIIPKFFALADAAGFPGNRITLVGVDREKKTLSHLAGKERGRVVEFGKYGLFDKELGEILLSIDKP